MSDDDTSRPRRVECPASSDVPVRMFILAAILIGVGVWCFLDRHNYTPPTRVDFEHFGQAFSYALNHYGLFVLAPLGVLAAIHGWRARKQLLVADESGIGFVGKPRVRWSQATGLDASKLESKQILYLRLADGKRLKLDGVKLRNFRALVAFLEQKLGPENADEAARDEAEEPAQADAEPTKPDADKPDKQAPRQDEGN